MAESATETRGSWNSKIGFVLAAAGSAVGLGNIWKFPTEAASNGGAVFLILYVICIFIVGFPVMMAELTIGRKTRKNPVGAFRALSNNFIYPIIGVWGLVCGVVILSFYMVVAGWTFGYVFEEIFFYLNMQNMAELFGNFNHGIKNSIFAILFMTATIAIITGGVSNGIEKATKTMMPILIGILVIMIGYVVTQEGSSQGLSAYLQPDFSNVSPSIIFNAMGQAFFSLSLGMGAMITYGSYLNENQNIAESALFVTVADTGIAFLAGLLIMPTMFVAQANGVQIFTESGDLVASSALVFQVLPELFHQLGGLLGLIIGVLFFLLLSIAALTSTISLLEVPTSFAIDEFGVARKKAAVGIGLAILVISLFISFDISLIGSLDTVFNKVGLPLGGMLTCLFVGFVWKAENAINEIEHGFPGVHDHFISKVWPFFIRYVCPVLILFNLLSDLVF